MFRGEADEADEYPTLYYIRRFRVCKNPMDFIPHLLPDDRIACDYVDQKGTTTREGGYFRSYRDGVLRVSPLKLCTQHGMKRKKTHCQKWRVASADSPNDGVVRLYLKPSTIERISSFLSESSSTSFGDRARTSDSLRASTTCEVSTVSSVGDTLASTSSVEAALPIAKSMTDSQRASSERRVKKDPPVAQAGVRNITPGYSRW
jgi:hypothetical protein